MDLLRSSLACPEELTGDRFIRRLGSCVPAHDQGKKTRYEGTKFPGTKHPALAQLATEHGATGMAGAGHLAVAILSARIPVRNAQDGLGKQ